MFCLLSYCCGMSNYCWPDQSWSNVEESQRAPSPYLFRFPDDKVVSLKNGQKVDISNIEIDLVAIIQASVNIRGGGAPKITARAMEAFGHGNGVFNLPYCIVAYLGLKKFQKELKTFATDHSLVDPSTIRDQIQENISEGFTHFNLPMSLDGHTSLICFVITDNCAVLRFYDSLPDEIIHYSDRYTDELFDFLQPFLPLFLDFVREETQVLHLLCQGDSHSTGCGYYTLYTALVLKEDKAFRNLTKGEPLYTEADDPKIRAELAVLTLLDHGIERVDTSSLFLNDNRAEGIFSQLQNAQRPLIRQLKERLIS
jgi:hypothetical protein